MKELPARLTAMLEDRREEGAFRTLGMQSEVADFSSNDYLGFARDRELYKNACDLVLDVSSRYNGSTGSRLLSGNHSLYERAEVMLGRYYSSESALIFNSGFDANSGLLSALGNRNDVILYDEYAHASIREGIKLCHARNYKFRHNDIQDLKRLLNRYAASSDEFSSQTYVVTESVFSMDGDSPELRVMSELCAEYGARLIVDEAHAVGIHGKKGEGLVVEKGLEGEVFARVITFGKALGGNGAAVLGSRELTDYLVNFSRSLIYTTALPPHTIATVIAAHQKLLSGVATKKIKEQIGLFRKTLFGSQVSSCAIESHSAIHCLVVSGNDQVKKISAELFKEGLDVKAILSPTVPRGKERLRICLHTYNDENEIKSLIKTLEQHL
ncbi:aminotransferase class I/II-fold pyridoxal phosphate-dependent enzyme [Robertkochia aurantiaca]|uniref:aminotransferase class I/II-fold pyridoxal phosphate-dependent enzyme n=1 Tax=Robertkochia aurantiaca TaxID=2873700 RepID=UPI001CCF0EF3|nr:aminotransferase class I/II-fold pyridoxal phosphate-dependent enzyme [Robertkochia sp. 3YJGBD-33]